MIKARHRAIKLISCDIQTSFWQSTGKFYPSKMHSERRYGVFSLQKIFFVTCLLSVVCVQCFSISGGISESVSYQCPTCSNAECANEEEVPLVDCIPPTMVHSGFLINAEVAEEFACLDMEYKKGEQVSLLKRCVVRQQAETLCEELKLEVEKLEATLSKCLISSASPSVDTTAETTEATTEGSDSTTEDSETGSTTIVDTEATTTTDGETPPDDDSTTTEGTTPTPDPGSGVIHQISYIVVIFVTLGAFIL